MKQYEALEDGTVVFETDQPSFTPEMKWMPCHIKKGQTFTLNEHELAKNPKLTVQNEREKENKL